MEEPGIPGVYRYKNIVILLPLKYKALLVLQKGFCILTVSRFDINLFFHSFPGIDQTIGRRIVIADCIVIL